jgi:HPr kinase/phosphorylase
MLPERAPDAVLAEGVPGPGVAVGSTVRLHASCVRIGHAGVLLLGRSGTGKSDLALRLIDRGACLIADDQVLVERRTRRLIARAPDVLRGLIEMRGVGVVRLPWQPSTSLSLAVELTGARPKQRLPGRRIYPLLGLSLPLVTLDPFAVSAPAALRVLLRAEFVA